MIGGVDEAGRGPVIGPLIIAGIALEEGKIPLLERIGVRDSKLLSPKRRKELLRYLNKIAENIIIEEIPPSLIDDYVNGRFMKKLNLLEAEVMAKVISVLGTNLVYVDSSDINSHRFARTIEAILKTRYNIHHVRIIAEIHADKKYPIVSAASIIAKVIRDERIKELHRAYGDFGSGYPSDSKTIYFIKRWIAERGELPPIVRKSWRTVKRLRREFFKKELSELF